MTNIRKIHLRVILDSRGNPTIEADITTDHGYGRFAAPSGAVTGMYEARVRDPVEALSYGREHVIPRLIGEDSLDQIGIDALLHDIDGSSDFATIGTNLAITLSLANATAAAASTGVPLYQHIGGLFIAGPPLPLAHVLGGGVSTHMETGIKEFLVVPVGAPSVTEGVFANAQVHHAIGSLLAAEGIFCGKGDEGAWSAQVTDTKALEIVSSAAAEVSDDCGFGIDIGIDVAAGEIYDPETKMYCSRQGDRSPEEQLAYISELVRDYHLVYVEDPLFEDDYELTAELTAKVGGFCLVCGDDLFATNTSRIRQGIQAGSANCVSIKPNQVGTLTDTFESVKLARSHGLETVMSHRSGETTDTTIAHLATAFESVFLKTGAAGGERIAKLNELIRIEEEME
ncbi:MAG: phosphopyruvate hydratase [Methanospirillaceae archaeon]|nr:phosphopyruvate hydratase [Methanospirillaceae archaeon]